MPSPTPSIASDDAIDHHLDDSVNDEARGGELSRPLRCSMRSADQLDRDIEMDDGIYQSGNQSGELGDSRHGEEDG